MRKTLKKLTGILLVLFLTAALFPPAAGRAYAEGEAFSLYVNGESAGTSVTREWMEENQMEPQIFPYPAQQGKEWIYVVAQGPSFEAVLAELTGAESLADLKDVSIRWNNESGVEQGKFDLEASDLQQATACFKLVDQDGNDITGRFDGEEYVSAEAVALEGAADVTPIVALRQKGYDTYTEAAAALADESWKTDVTTSIRPFVGGILDKETFLKKDGAVKMGVFNFTGKFSMADLPQLNLKFTAEPATSSLTFKTKDAQSVDFQYALTDTEKALLLGTATWASSDTAVATVDQTGKVTPAGKVGSCDVTATATIAGEATEIGRCAVTVTQDAFPPADKPSDKPAEKKENVKPAKPTGLKVVNVKKRSAKLKWKKAARADGYIIYRSLKKNKGFKKIKTIKKAKTVTFTNKKLKKGKTYYYKIKSYRKYQGKTLYSPLTAAKKVKVKK